MKAWPPPYEALVGDLSGAYSRRINIQPRLIYQVLDNERREYSSSLPG
ncbi:type II toxin-antitoxin system YoeB family toxin [Cyanobium sp. BA5m-10]|nr:type II toxin-antitoxin system YoeB family toxin [Cyanobium sp. BA5m-10]